MPVPELLALAMPGIVQGGTGLISGVVNNLFNMRNVDKTNAANRQMTAETNAMNRQMFNEQMAYTKQLQQQMFQREDNSYQRTVSDIQKAGLSPLAINGTNDAGSVVASPTPNPALAGRDIAFEGTAPQIQVGEIADAMLAKERLNLERERLNLDISKHGDDVRLREKEDQTRREIAVEENSTRIETTMMQIKSQAEQLGRKLSQEQQQHLDNLALNTRHIESIIKATDTRLMLEEQNHYIESVKALTGSSSINYKVYKDESKYKEALAAFQTRFADAFGVNARYLFVGADSRSNSAAAGAGANVGTIPGWSVGANGNASTSNSESHSRDMTEEYKERMKLFFLQNPVPLLNIRARYSD